MIRKAVFVFFILFLFINGFSQTTLFDADWRFYRGGVQGAEMPGFDDAKWRKIDLPHDWSIEDLPTGQAGLPGIHTPFDPNAISQVSGGFTVGGTGWYRKTFAIGPEQKNKRILIQFDGVYMNADFWLNGESLGTHPYGYTSFWFDITNKIKFGEKNTIIVQVKNEGQNSRWYSGSGIYRHVWLKMLDPVHISPWGIYITTPEASASFPKVNIKTVIANEADRASNVKLVTYILDSSGNEFGRVESEQRIDKSASHEFAQELVMDTADLWSPESPVL